MKEESFDLKVVQFLPSCDARLRLQDLNIENSTAAVNPLSLWMGCKVGPLLSNLGCAYAEQRPLQAARGGSF